MRRRLTSITIVASLLLASSVAFAQDEVTLKNGAVLHGTVVSSKPGVSVKIIEAGHKKPRTIPWSHVSDVSRGGSKPAAASKPAADAPPASEPAAPAESAPSTTPAASSAPAPAPGTGVKVHIDSPKPALLYSHEQASGTFDGHSYTLERVTPVCAAPCDVEVDASGDHTFTASGDFGTSAPFSLSGHQGDTEVSLHPGNPTIHTTGMVLTVGGGVVTVLGATLAITGAILSGANVTVNGKATEGATFPIASTITPVGLVVTGVGVAMVVGGVVALLTNKTSVDLHPMGASAGKAEGRNEIKPRYWAGEF